MFFDIPFDWGRLVLYVFFMETCFMAGVLFERWDISKHLKVWNLRFRDRFTDDIEEIKKR